MSGEGRPRVRFRVRLRFRFRGRLGVLCGFAALPAFACSETGFSPGGVCEKSMSVSSCCLRRHLSRGPRLPGGGGSAVPVSCRWLSPMVPAAGAAPLVPLRVDVTVTVSVVIAVRVVASRRLLVSLARVVRLGPGSARRSCAAVVSWSYTAPPSLSRRMAGRWCTGGARAARRPAAICGFASKRSWLGVSRRSSPAERSSQGGGVL